MIISYGWLEEKNSVQGNCWDWECLLPHFAERWTFFNASMTERRRRIQVTWERAAQAHNQPWSAQALAVFPVLLCLHRSHGCFGRGNLLWFWRGISPESWESVIKSVFLFLLVFHRFTNELFLMNPLFLEWTRSVSCWWLGSFTRGLLPVGLLLSTSKGTVAPFLSTQTLAACFPSCAHLHSQTCFFQSDAREARRHKATEWLILDSVAMCVHFPRFWFPVWKFKILWREYKYHSPSYTRTKPDFMSGGESF